MLRSVAFNKQEHSGGLKCEDKKTAHHKIMPRQHDFLNSCPCTNNVHFDSQATGLLAGYFNKSLKLPV